MNSIGSLGKHGANDEVEYIDISDVVFTNTTNGARIKTWQVKFPIIYYMHKIEYKILHKMT